MTLMSPKIISVPTFLERHILSQFNLTKNINPRLIEIVERRCSTYFVPSTHSEFVIFHEIPDRVTSFILLFLAKPIVMNLQMDDPIRVRQIGVCPVLGTWNKTCRQILDQYQMDCDQHRVYSLEKHHCTVSKDNWEG